MTTGVDISEWEKDPRLFLFTSLTAGSSHIVTATSRLETILRANKLPFQAVDTATDEGARRLWGRRGGKRKLPGLVKEGYVIADLEEVEDWNEFGELKENIGPLPPAGTSVNTIQTTLGSLRMHDAGSQASTGSAPAAKGPTPGVNASKIKPLPSGTPVPAPAPAATETPSQDTPAVPATDATSTEQKHSGGSVSKASAEEAKEVDKSTSVPKGDEIESSEKAEAKESTEKPKAKAVEAEEKERSDTPKVEAVETAEAEKIPSQESAAAEEAETSVED